MAEVLLGALSTGTMAVASLECIASSSTGVQLLAIDLVDVIGALYQS